MNGVSYPALVGLDETQIRTAARAFMEANLAVIVAHGEFTEPATKIFDIVNGPGPYTHLADACAELTDAYSHYLDGSERSDEDLDAGYRISGICQNFTYASRVTVLGVLGIERSVQILARDNDDADEPTLDTWGILADAAGIEADIVDIWKALAPTWPGTGAELVDACNALAKAPGQ